MNTSQHTSQPEQETLKAFISLLARHTANKYINTSIDTATTANDNKKGA
jgi:hypothetical protein